MKKITYTAAILSVALFSSASFAGFDNEDDILTGSGKVVATPGAPYVQAESGPNGTETDVLSNLHEVKSSGKFSPYERVSGDRDNSDDLIDRVS